MKKIIFPACLCLVAANTLCAQPGKTVVVRDLDGLLRNIASNTTIHIESEKLLLDSDSENPVPDSAHVSLIGGQCILVKDVENLTIIGKPAVAEKHCSILTTSTHSLVMEFENVKGVTLQNLSLGHTAPVCRAGVLAFRGSERVHLKDMDLFGCGTFGLEIKDVSRLLFEDSVIHDCREFALSIHGSNDISFVSSEIRMIGGPDLNSSIRIHGSKGIVFEEMSISKVGGLHLFGALESEAVVIRRSRLFENPASNFLNVTDVIESSGNTFSGNVFIEPEGDEGTGAPVVRPPADRFYVHAKSGLRLREGEPGGPSFSRIIGGLPFGASVKRVSTTDHAETVGQIPGRWVYIEHGGREGYVFDGYLSALPVPSISKKDWNWENRLPNYYRRLKASGIRVQYSNETQGDEGYAVIASTLTILGVTAKDALLAGKELFDLPEFVTYPVYKGREEVTLSNPDKASRVWIDEFKVRFDKEGSPLEFAHYHRMEGGGSHMNITKKAGGAWSISIGLIAD